MERMTSEGIRIVLSHCKGGYKKDFEKKEWVAVDDLVRFIDNQIELSKRLNKNNSNKYECEMRLNDIKKALNETKE